MLGSPNLPAVLYLLQQCLDRGLDVLRLHGIELDRKPRTRSGLSPSLLTSIMICLLPNAASFRGKHRIAAALHPNAALNSGRFGTTPLMRNLPGECGSSLCARRAASGVILGTRLAQMPGKMLGFRVAVHLPRRAAFSDRRDRPSKPDTPAARRRCPPCFRPASTGRSIRRLEAD